MQANLSTHPAPEASNRLKMAIGIATIGRADILSSTIAELRRQTRPADAIFVCATAPADIADLARSDPDVTVIIGPHGSSHQRNAILDRLDEFDVVVFLDDDFAHRVAGSFWTDDARIAASGREKT